MTKQFSLEMDAFCSKQLFNKVIKLQLGLSSACPVTIEVVYKIVTFEIGKNLENL